MKNSRIPSLKFHHVSLNVHDYDKTVQFYEALGCRVYCEWETEDGEWTVKGKNCFMDTGDGPFIELHYSPNADLQANRFQHFCFHVDDVDEVYRIAMENGATSLMEPTTWPLNCKPKPIPNPRICHFLGVDGEPIEVINWGGYNPYE